MTLSEFLQTSNREHPANLNESNRKYFLADEKTGPTKPTLSAMGSASALYTSSNSANAKKSSKLRLGALTLVRLGEIVWDTPAFHTRYYF